METPMPYEDALELDEDREIKRRKINLSSGLDVSRARLLLDVAVS